MSARTEPPASGAKPAHPHFRKNDLVLGPSAGGALSAFQQANGGRLLSDLDLGKLVTWEDFAIDVLERAAKRGGQVHFDLTHMDHLSNVLDGWGRRSKAITAIELRFIRWNYWDFRVKPKFYRDGAEVPPPWW